MPQAAQNGHRYAPLSATGTTRAAHRHYPIVPQPAHRPEPFRVWDAHFAFMPIATDVTNDVTIACRLTVKQKIVPSRIRCRNQAALPCRQWREQIQNSIDFSSLRTDKFVRFRGKLTELGNRENIEHVRCFRDPKSKTLHSLLPNVRPL